MDRIFEGTAAVLTNYAIGRPTDRTDLMIVTLRSGESDLLVALDRRIAERLSADLAKVAKKLTPPRHEN